MSALKTGSMYVDLMSGARGTLKNAELYARGEGGWKFSGSGSAFAYGEGIFNSSGLSWQAGLGVGWKF